MFVISIAEKVSNICCDVIGDICGIVSGSAGALIAIKLSTMLNVDVVIVSLILSAFVAMITVGGKAIGKGISMNKAENIMSIVGAVIHLVAPVKDTTKKKKVKQKENKKTRKQ